MQPEVMEAGPVFPFLQSCGNSAEVVETARMDVRVFVHVVQSGFCVPDENLQGIFPTGQPVR